MKRARNDFTWLALGLAAVISTATHAAGDVYQWTDEDGVPHFSDAPPPAGTEAESRELDPIPNAGVQAPPEVTQSVATEAAQDEAVNPAEQRRQDRAEQRARRAEEQEQLQELCQQAQRNLAALEPRPNLLVTGPDGEVTRMDDTERVNAIEANRAFIEENCDGR